MINSNKKIIKRDGRLDNFDRTKIEVAIKKAFNKVDSEVTEYAETKASKIAEYIESKVKTTDYVYNVEEIQDMVENGLMSTKRKDVAREYITYRNERTAKRGNIIDKEIRELLNDTSEHYKTENANKNSILNTTKRDYMAGAISVDITRRELLPKDILDAHDNGEIHFHDADYFAQHMHNCDLINLEDMLQNGHVISEVLIEKPKAFSTACNIATQDIAQIASSQYGGQSITLTHLAPFVDISRQKIYKEVENEIYNIIGLEKNSDLDKRILDIVNERLKKEINRGVQTIQYQLTTLMTTNGQAPFITIFMYLNEARNEREKEDLAMIIEEVLKQRIVGVKNKNGAYIAPAFPKLIYVLEEDNITEDSKYWYLTELAAECSAKRLVPDYISEKVMKELKGDVYTCMGCRSFLTPDRFSDKVGNIANAKNYVEGEHKYYGRFNQGVVTINLPYIALSSGGNEDKFWELLDSKLELCHRALIIRHNRLKGTSVEVAPILWKYGALARLEDGETIDKLLYHGYSTISLGYAGIYECTKYMTGCSHSDEGIGETFALKVMQFMNDKCDQWKKEENIDYSIYGTPLESTTYKFAKALKKFGNIEGITDRDYVTNSYHIPVFEHINAFEKLRIESKFQKLSPGGAVSYVESPSMVHNIPAILEVIKYMYETIMYAEINTKSCYCRKCGFNGNIELVANKDGKLGWKCPNCGNEDGTSMDIAFRTCGYIGTSVNGANQGRYSDIHDRVYHLDDIEEEL